ncbi:MAG: type II secretion system protein [Phycisphaerae bacterium]
MKKRIGFTLVELLVVISIIAILLAMLMPALRRAQGQAKATVCRNNVKQWGMMLTMYANDNNGHFVPGFNVKQGMWMVKLRPYYSGAGKIRLCPKATQYLSNVNMVTSIFTAWGVYGSKPYQGWYPGSEVPGVPDFGEAGDYGSYGINAWIDDPVNIDPSPSIDDGVLYSIPLADRPNYWRTMYQKNPGTIPAFGDSVWEGTEAAYSDNPPTIKPGESKTTSKGMFNYCIPRHGLAINLAFLDNSARKVSIKELWDLKWSQTFKTGKNIRWENIDWVNQDWGN